MLEEISGWGVYPKCKALIHAPNCFSDTQDLILKSPDAMLPRGMGRSYGDSSLSPHVVQTDRLRYLIQFDINTGLLECDAGVTIGQVIDTFIPKGWFIPVTPGTQYVSIGGAIASDVHGKNHHVDGSFSEFLLDFKILLGTGEIVTASRDQNSDLFMATCGGMGLTGVILSARFYLKRIQSSLIEQKILKAKNLSIALANFEKSMQSTYSVAWIDCMAKGRDLGRSHIILGEHAKEGGLDIPETKQIDIPFAPSFSPLNNLTIRIFNEIYYQKQLRSDVSSLVPLKTFFYPLDKLHHWNRLYGPNGFVQYQCVIPKNCGEEGIRRVLELVSQSGQGSFLAVLKALGPQNKNYLSFPLEGYTLALDFKWMPAVSSLLNKLDDVVSSFGGRLYLTKDSRMSPKFFRQGYPRLDEFERVRKQYGATDKFTSMQSIRLGIR
ncbi:FAD-binding oxidoreductase [Polynucleobacter wuianus]|uniref:FAD-binding oxidoreductase n=1 Tax=Polynucleobacter wuianus TaxID=1743168 RepID=UPI001EC92523|nr:FAD-binding oxidoreductase [Polynucleobacter wuianus]MBU3609287.1 FAD-binding oxidoreductase [Polynucleobacter wuianus]